MFQVIQIPSMNMCLYALMTMILGSILTFIYVPQKLVVVALDALA